MSCPSETGFLLVFSGTHRPSHQCSLRGRGSISSGRGFIFPHAKIMFMVRYCHFFSRLHVCLVARLDSPESSGPHLRACDEVGDPGKGPRDVTADAGGGQTTL